MKAITKQQAVNFKKKLIEEGFTTYYNLKDIIDLKGYIGMYYIKESKV